MRFLVSLLAITITSALSIPIAHAHADHFVVVTEFYNSALKQYFRTANLTEAAGIDAGAAGLGWTRTGDNFATWQQSGAATATVDVCRFYGSLSPGPNSHFFTASANECAGLRGLQATTPATQKRWNYEGIAFAAQLPSAAGICAAGSAPIYRAYNKGNERGIDSNHRFSSKKAEYDKMVAQGWAGEGVVMCGCDSQTDRECAALIAASVPSGGSTSFKRLMDAVITPQCGSCHATPASGGLVLDAANAYKNLVNITPANAAAAAAQFKLITPGNADKSFLYEKLLLWDNARTQKYDAPMPLGTTSLTVGQLEFIKRWINEGASPTTDSIPADLLNNLALPEYAPFVPLPVPSAGQGYQLTTGAFPVPGNFERELFIYRELKNPAPIYVNRFDTRMRANSHHLILYAFGANTPSFIRPAPNVIRDLRNPDNSLNVSTALAMAFHVFIGGSMTQSGGYQFPPGVALELPANMGVDLNSHYVNKTTTPFNGEAFANFYTVDRAQVSQVASTLNLANTSFELPPGKRTTATQSFIFDQKRTVLMLTSHTHALGEKFVIRFKGGARDGEILYTNTDWSHPVATTYDPPLVFEPGQGLTSEITYNNTKSVTVKFGLTSEDEMGIIFGYYY